ncbi:MAG: hypothetical protein GQ532_14195 [Methylomarinum sp.]|nr:hypothetical protein [Methylomarinum sp.]
MHELITIDVSSTKTKGLGCKKYKSIPRIGEWVELSIDEIGHMYEVVMVAHSSDGAGSDIFVRHLSESTQARRSLLLDESE